MSAPPPPPVVWRDRLDEAGAADETEAWVFTLDSPEAAARAGLAPSAGDTADVGARRGEDARRFLHRRAVLRHLVAQRLRVPPEGVRIGYDAAGRPLVRDPPHRLFCAVAARGPLAALALSPVPVGIDCEPLDSGPIPWSVLTTRETADLRGLAAGHRPPAFLSLWVAKEAYLKALGSGLMRDPAEIEVTLAPALALRDRTAGVPLAAGALRRMSVAGRAVVVACLALPSPGRLVETGKSRSHGLD